MKESVNFVNTTGNDFFNISRSPFFPLVLENGCYLEISNKGCLHLQVSPSGGYRLFDGKFSWYVQPTEAWYLRWEVYENTPNYIAQPVKSGNSKFDDWKDISSEMYRTYTFPNTKEYTITNTNPNMEFRLKVNNNNQHLIWDGARVHFIDPKISAYRVKELTMETAESILVD